MFQRLPPILQTINQIISMSMVTLYMLMLMVNVKEINHKKHLIQFPISVDLEKVRNSDGTFQVSYCSAES